MTRTTMSRRQFLTGASGLFVAFSMLGSGSKVFALTKRGALAGEGSPPTDLDSWLVIDPANSVTVFTGRVDIGTGTETGWMQMVAEELDISPTAIKIVMGDTAVTPDQGKSTASSGMSYGAQPLRVAAAETRRLLVQLAGNRLDVPTDQLVTKDGSVIVNHRSSRRLSYGEIVGDDQLPSALEVVSRISFGPIVKVAGTKSWESGLKSPNQYQVVGTSVKRVDIPDKVTGDFTFVHDVELPGMLHGRVVRPPAVGATLKAVDEGSVRDIPGTRVVRKGNFLGVVAESEWAAIQAAQQLKTTWSDGTGLPEQSRLYKSMRNAKVLKTEASTDVGNVDTALAGADKVLRSTYEFAYHDHGMIGPSCAVADVNRDRVLIWSGTQWPVGTRDDVADMLGVPRGNVKLLWAAPSGCYGRMGVDDAAADAALLSKAVGKPVRVQWMREDEHRWEPVSPAVTMDFTGGLDADGNVVAWNWEYWSASHSTAERGNELAWRLIGTAPGHDRLSGGAGAPLYTFANERITTHYVEPFLRSIYMRSPGGIQGCLGIETFMDELAAAAGRDPIAFRLQYLHDERSIAVLKAAAKRFGWESRPSPRADAADDVVVGRGIALSDGGIPVPIDSPDNVRVAGIAEVEVNKKTGDVRVRRMAVALDPGLIVNPDGLRSQIEGGTIQGVSRALKEEVRFDQSRVTSVDWNSYPILTFPEVPTIDIELINRKDLQPCGVGEPPTNTPPAAISNAIFDATGARVRTVPFTPDRVKDALKRV